MTLKPILLACALGLSAALAAEPKLALLGPFGGERAAETQAAQEALDAANAAPGGPRLKLAVFNTGGDEASALAAVRRAADDDEVVAAVLHGEAAAGPECLAALKRAGLAAVAASSMARARTPGSGVTWLSPSLSDLAQAGAAYARREARAVQVAVLHDGSAGSAEAAQAFANRFRALGGKVPYEGAWGGGEEGLAATVKGMALHWPQMVFFAGGGEEAGRLLLAMKAEKSLKSADLIGLPPLFDPAFFSAVRLKGARTRAIFPCPDYEGVGAMLRNLGFAFPRSSPEYRAYVHFANRRPGRWTSMIYDAVALAARAVRQAGPEGAQGAAAPPRRPEVREALLAIPGYRGIRGAVRFDANREPSDSKAMIYFAMNRVNKKEMLWKQKAYGPPF